MERPPGIVPAAIVRGTLAGLAARGLPAAPSLFAAGIPPPLLAAGGRGVDAASYTRLYRLLADRLDDEAVGLLSRPLRRGSFALVLRSALGAPTVDAALRRAARTFSLLQDDLTLERLRESGRAGVALVFGDPAPERAGPAPAPAPNFLHELLLRVTWLVTAWLQGGPLQPLGFDFAFAEPAYAADYARIFPGTLRFGQARSALWVDDGVLAAPARRDTHALRIFLAAAPGNVVAGRLVERTVADRVRALLQRARPTWPDLAAVARTLQVSPSTLQRRLSAEGTSFRAVRDALRRDVAVALLESGPASSLAALSEELGFADGPAFQRAFKAWTGRAPGAYRCAARGGRAPPPVLMAAPGCVDRGGTAPP
jgi:AraC-like DNA-binding protein